MKKLRRSAYPYCLAIACVSIGMMPAFGSAAAILILLCALPMFSWQALDGHRFFIFVIAQYLVIQLFFNLYHTPGLFSSRTNDAYIVLLLSILPIMSLFLQSKATREQVIKYVTLGLVLSTVMLSEDLFMQEQCRVKGQMFNTLGTAALFSGIAFFVVILSLGSKSVSAHFGFGVVALLFVVLSAYTSARMSFYVAILVTCFLFAYLFLKKAPLRTVGQLLSWLFLSAVVVCCIELVTECGFLNRIYGTFESVQSLFGNVLGRQSVEEFTFQSLTESGMQSSEGARLSLWVAAVEKIPQALWFGYGQMNESATIAGIAGFPATHAHQQYLSWFIWGGVFGFMSGAGMLFAPVFISENKVSICFAIAPWVFIFLTDSLFFFSEMIATFLVFYCFAYAIVTTFENDTPKTVQNDVRRPNSRKL